MSDGFLFVDFRLSLPFADVLHRLDVHRFEVLIVFDMELWRCKSGEWIEDDGD